MVGWLVRFLGDVAEVDVELVVFDGGVGPADDVFFPEDGHGVVAELSFRFGGVGFEAVAPAPEMFEAGSVAHDGIEGAEDAHGVEGLLSLLLVGKGEVFYGVDKVDLDATGFDEVLQAVPAFFWSCDEIAKVSHFFKKKFARRWSH